VQLSALEVTFKLDPRLTRGVYMGDRWVSPATYTRVQEPGKDLVVDARAEGRGLQGETVQVSPAWTSSDPDVLYVVPTKGAAVEIHVLGEGTSDLSVAGNGASRQYQVNVTRQIEALRVDIVRK
jgi:hypothetical protein